MKTSWAGLARALEHALMAYDEVRECTVELSPDRQHAWAVIMLESLAEPDQRRWRSLFRATSASHGVPSTFDYEINVRAR